MEQRKYVYKKSSKSPATTTYKGLEKVISGGQTGADRGALEAARSVGIPTGGTAPEGWKTENGSDRSLKTFGLKEGPEGYPPRTRMNVDNADATLAILLHPGNGTERTIGYAQTKQWTRRSDSSDKGYRPVFVLTSLDKSQVQPVCDFLERNRVRVLNVGGHRETTAGVDNFTEKVTDFLRLVFETHSAAYLQNDDPQP